MNAKIVWNPKLQVNSDIIDNQHKILFDLIKDISNAINTGVNIKVLDVLLGVFRDYAFQHFEIEEEFFKNHTDYTNHCLEHYALIKKLNRFIIDFRNNRTEKIPTTSEFLEDWLFGHIESYDKPFLTHKTVDLRLLNESETIDEFDPDLEDRRHHKRIARNEVVDGNILTHCYNATRLKSGMASIVNMSPGGLLLSSTRKHEVDDLLVVSCSIGQTFKMKEKVKVRTARDQMYGVQFVSPARETILFFTELYGSIHFKNIS
ncbi:MAG: hemerythrin domain-containing protein [Desulforhopalus sp.]